MHVDILRRTAFAAIRVIAVAGFVALVVLAGPVARAQTPPPEKVNELIELLSDPGVQTWLKEQGTAARPAAQSKVAAEATSFSSLLASRIAKVRQHLKSLAEAVPRLPAQFERARIILLLEFAERGLVLVLALIAGFIVVGMAFDKLARHLLRGYLAWMKNIPWDEPMARLRGLAARSLYALAMIAAFILGSAGMFLVFDWPPLLHEIVLAYLWAAVVTRVVLMLGRLVLLPPSLGMPNAAQYRVLPVSDASAQHWYLYAGLNTGWFAFVAATMGLLATFGFDQPSRQAIGVVAGLVQLVLLLAAIWRRPVEAGGTASRFQPRTASWLLTAFFIAIWLLRISGAWTAFWFVFALGALPAIIAAAKKAVQHVLRPPEEGSAGKPVAPVTVAVVDRGIRVVLIAAAAYFLARVWGIEFAAMSQPGSAGDRILRAALDGAIILLAADFAWSVIKAVIARKLGEGASPDDTEQRRKQARMRTLLPIVQNVLFAVILVMAVLMILSAMGFEIGPLIAGAGVVGVAIGFGAQTLVRDVISGMFYLLDDAFRVGEYIESGSFRGTVESFSLRSVKLRHHRGYIYTVPFGELGAVQNMSRDWVIDKFNITVGYDTDVDKARKIVKKIGLELAADPEYAAHVIEPIKMQGVQQFSDYGIDLRIKMKTKPGEQFPMKRRAYVLIKKAFEEAGITLPIPTVQVKGEEPAAAAALHAVAAAQPPPA